MVKSGRGDIRSPLYNSTEMQESMLPRSPDLKSPSPTSASLRTWPIEKLNGLRKEEVQGEQDGLAENNLAIGAPLPKRPSAYRNGYGVVFAPARRGT